MTYLVNPRNGRKESYDWDICPGALLLGPFWFLFKGMIGWFFLSIFLNLITLGLAYLPIAFLAHKIHRRWLEDKGYVSEEVYRNHKWMFY